MRGRDRLFNNTASLQILEKILGPSPCHSWWHLWISVHPSKRGTGPSTTVTRSLFPLPYDKTTRVRFSARWQVSEINSGEHIGSLFLSWTKAWHPNQCTFTGNKAYLKIKCLNVCSNYIGGTQSSDNAGRRKNTYFLA